MVLLTGSKTQHMHTGVKQSKSLGMGFRSELELPISSSPDTSDLTSPGRKAGTDVAEGAGAQSIPTATSGHHGGDTGLDCSQHVCLMIRATTGTSQASAPTLVAGAEP